MSEDLGGVDRTENNELKKVRIENNGQLKYKELR